jgi:uncharacterized protein YdhG (YjbR/CyaY superfamily)
VPKAAKDPAFGKKDVEAYLARLPDVQRATLEKVRETIRSIVPEATEAISYGIPGFRLNGKGLVWYAAFKNHCSFFPLTAGVRKLHGKELERYETSKGTLRYRIDKPPPKTLIRKLVKARIADEQARSKS